MIDMQEANNTLILDSNALRAEFPGIVENNKVIRSQRLDLKTELDSAEIELQKITDEKVSKIVTELNEAGKPKFSNDSSRAIELRKQLEGSESAFDLVNKIKGLKRKIQDLQDSLDYNRERMQAIELELNWRRTFKEVLQ